MLGSTDKGQGGIDPPTLTGYCAFAALQSGRMKGQAFITFPSIEDAQRALVGGMDVVVRHVNTERLLLLQAYRH